MPFWFWNDVLDEKEILRQIDDFEKHGVFGFTIHPRVGLPRDCGWMSDKLLGYMRLAIDEAARRGMKVILYDEGMYPSGSASGLVVARYPQLACRGLALHTPDQPLPPGANRVADIELAGLPRCVVDRPIDSYIRGLHYIDEGPAEDEPPAGDILNPATSAAVIELVHDVFARRFGDRFGSTIIGLFTDEPSPIGKCRETDVVAGTTGIVEEVSRLLGFDFRPHLRHLWSSGPEAEHRKAQWQHGIRLRLGETWYAPLSRWCESHALALCGHPDKGDDIGAQRYFHIPGQDLVWRWVEPGRQTGIEGDESTQAKNTSSAMIHLRRRRNSNEFAGAYGAQTTFQEVTALANWCLVRGVNLLVPHAFFYSVRGPRREERPPQVGPHTPAWNTDQFKHFADACRRLCWINTDSRHLCDVAVLTHADRCPWPAAAALLTHQRDFNYLEPQLLLEQANVDSTGIRIGGMHYKLLILDGAQPLSSQLELSLDPLIRAERVLRWGGAPEGPRPCGIPTLTRAKDLIAAVDAASSLPLRLTTDSRALRLRLVEKQATVYALVFNEGASPAAATVSPHTPAQLHGLDLLTGQTYPAEATLALSPFELRVLCLTLRQVFT